MKHSPTPWSHQKMGILAEGRERENLEYVFRQFESDNDTIRVMIAENCESADAKFIVQTVNLHAEMVKALENALASYRPVFSHSPVGRQMPVELPEPSWVINIRSILAKAKEIV